MCFESNKKLIKQKATKDIICYKICEKKDDIYYSIYYNMKYEKNKIYKLHKELKKLKIVYYNMSDKFHHLRYEINEGYHSYVTLIKAVDRYFYMNELNLYICKFLIPKGSIYYKNDEMKTYVSDEIKFIDKLNSSDFENILKKLKENK